VRVLSDTILGVITGVGIILGFIMGRVKMLLYEGRSKCTEPSQVGNGVIVTRGEGSAVGVISECLSVVLIKENEPVRWFEIRSPALIARAGEQRIESMMMDIIRGKIFI
jgi:hypothetical protein